jgi:thiamine pyrophosphokinase
VQQPRRAAVVFAAAPLEPTPRLRAHLARLEAPYVVAADRGAATALAFGYLPNLVIGDLDSAERATVAELERLGVPIEAHPRDKDATDGQLAVERALEVQPACLWLLGFLGGPRLDQAFANVLLLLTVADTPVTMLDAHNQATLVRPGAPLIWRPEPGEIVSLIPVAQDAIGVTTSGLRWPLDRATLRLADTRGVSNEPVSDEARVSTEHGALLVTRHFPDR